MVSIIVKNGEVDVQARQDENGISVLDELIDAQAGIYEILDKSFTGHTRPAVRDVIRRMEERGISAYKEKKRRGTGDAWSKSEQASSESRHPST